MSKVIMIQGTMSNAGKSLITAGLCRIFRQDGYQVAPFKSQNMALNSFITEDGLEIGRAQAMQAEAAGVRATVEMNPVLLKPTSDQGSQVIVNGEVAGNMNAREYFAYKQELFPKVQEAFESLCENYDMIVIEGAGSPAEINLKENDMVNMGIARMADADVLLVGDIDRGGVFAQLLGTLLLLEDEEKARVKGLIINKFRGDRSLLESGIAMLEEKAGIPVLGVIPLMDVDLEAEDSLAEKAQTCKGGVLDIVILRLPRISNFTDFAVFERRKDIAVRYVDRVEKMGNPDMILIPGTKNTMLDLNWMRQNGLEAAIHREASRGTVIFGICGGYQMLGEHIEDPENAESGGGMKGMGLLPVNTVFRKEKARTRICGNIGKVPGVLKCLEGLEVEGYEIHMGITEKKPEAQTFLNICERMDQNVSLWDGACCGNIYGTYLHGFFDKDNVAEKILCALAESKGIPFEPQNEISYQQYREKQYDHLADVLRKSMDLERIYEIMDNKDNGMISGN